MKVLVLNSGSSSIKYKLFEMEKEEVLFAGHIDGIGLARCIVKLWYRGAEVGFKECFPTHVDALVYALKSLKDKAIIRSYSEIAAVGHRVVHGGEKYSGPARVDNNVIKEIRKLAELAPLHNPPNLAGIVACKRLLPKTPQVAVFGHGLQVSVQIVAVLGPTTEHGNQGLLT